MAHQPVRSVEIPIREIDFHPTSYCDRGGRVFWWKGELYRGIRDQYASACEKLFNEGVVQRLVEKKFLVETELTALTLNGFPLVLKHRRVPFVSYANEWCPEMLKDAGIFLAEMVLELADDGLTPDIDTWDLLFDGCQPLYVDFCSIAPTSDYNDSWWRVFKDDFRSYFVYPLQLMAGGQGNLARWLLADYEHEVIHAELAALMGRRVYASSTKNTRKQGPATTSPGLPKPARRLARKWAKLFKSFGSRSNDGLRGYRLIQKLRPELENIPLPAPPCEQDSVEDPNPPLVPSDEWTQKKCSVYETLSDLRPATLLDIGCGRGWYSRLAASLGSKVVALDINDRQVAYCYRKARKNDLSILPLVMDILYPSPGHGTQNRTIAPALERLPCEMVLALSLVHLLVYDQHRTFEQIIETFAAFSKRWLLVEFISREDIEVSERWSDWHCLYTLENFVDVLQKQFRNVRTIPSYPESRVLLLCEK